LSLEAVEAETHVRRRFLQAIEEERWEELPGAVYGRGFVRLYAQAVGLDPRLAVEQFDHVWFRSIARQPRPTLAGGSGWWAMPDPLLRALEPARRLRTAGLLALVVAAVAVTGAWLLSRSARPPEQAASPPPSALAPAREPATDGSGAAESFAAPPAPQEPAQPQAPAQQAGVVLVVRVRDRCWIEVDVDGQRVFRRTATAGEVLRWQARQQLRIRLGRAEAVDLELNGRPLGPAGVGVVTRLFQAEAQAEGAAAR